MHSTNLPPAGKGVLLEHQSDGEYVRSKIVEPTAVRLVDEGVYGGYSVGISRPRIDRDVRAKGGRIVGGRIVELSVVDRPANFNAKFQIAKAARSGNMLYVGKSVKVPSLGAHVATLASLRKAQHITVLDRDGDLIEGRVASVGPARVQLDTRGYDHEGRNVMLADADIATIYKGSVPDGLKRDFDPGVGGGTDRDKLPSKAFADPKNRKYPIVSPKDVTDAWGLAGHADNPDAVRSRIRAIARRKGPDFVAALPDTATEKAAGIVHTHEHQHGDEPPHSHSHRHANNHGDHSQTHGHLHPEDVVADEPTPDEIKTDAAPDAAKGDGAVCDACGGDIADGKCGKCGKAYVAKEFTSDADADDQPSAEKQAPPAAAPAAAPPADADDQDGAAEPDADDQAPPPTKKAKKNKKAKKAAKAAKAQAADATKADDPDDVPWLLRRAHDFSCGVYKTADVLEAYASIEKNGVAAAVGPGTRSAIYAMLQKEMAEDGGSGQYADKILYLAKALKYVQSFIDDEGVDDDAKKAARDELHAAFKAANGISDDGPSLPKPTENGITPGQFRRGYLSAGHQREKAASSPAHIPTTTHPISASDYTRGALTAGHERQSPAEKLAGLHDALSGWNPEICRMDAQGSNAFDRQPMEPLVGRIDNHASASPTPVQLPSEPVAKAISEDEIAAIVTKAQAPLLDKLQNLQAQYEDLARSPDPARSALRGVTDQATSSTKLARPDKAKREARREKRAARRQEMIDTLQGLAASGDADQRLYAQDKLASLGVD